MFTEFFAIFGQVIIILALLVIALLLLSLLLGRVALKHDKFILPKLLLFTTDLFYGPFKKLAEKLGFDSTLVDHISVEVRNKVNKKEFDSIDNKDKIIVLPHCLRHPTCPATLERSGLECTLCNKCVIGSIKSKGEELGYSVYIIPGSTFIKGIAERNKSINAFTYLKFDYAYAKAKELESRLSKGENLGIFAGVPFAILP